MKLIANLLISFIVATWVVTISIISVQNAAPVTLQFLFLRSIELPFGLVLAFSAATGILGMAIAQPLLISGSQNSSSYDEDFDDEDF